MPSLQLQLRSLALPEPLPDAEQELGDWLAGVLGRAVKRGGAPVVALRLTEREVELLPLAPVVAERINVDVFVATLGRMRAEPARPETLALGVMGVFRARPGGAAIAQVFLEWPDNRWWHWRALIEDQALREDTASVRSALQGDAMPMGLGRWWSYARRTGAQAQFTLNAPVVH